MGINGGLFSGNLLGMLFKTVTSILEDVFLKMSNAAREKKKRNVEVNLLKSQQKQQENL